MSQMNLFNETGDELVIKIGDNISKCKIFVNDHIIGMIQEISLKLSMDTLKPEVTVVFPLLEKETKVSDKLRNSIMNSINHLSRFKFVKILYAPLLFHEDNLKYVNELSFERTSSDPNFQNI